MFTAALDETVVLRLKPVVERVAARASTLVAGGFLATLLLQASSITVIATMGLAQRGLLTLEQGILATLGAAVGTSVKAWFFVLPFEVLGPVLVAGCSLALVVARRFAWRRFLEIGFATGVVFLGWYLVASQAVPVLGSPGAQAWLASHAVASLPSLVATIAAGFLLAVLVQSGSTVVFLAIGLVAAGVLPFPVAVAVVLGANVGTTVVPLYASLEYRPRVRGIAVAHVLVKALGVAVAGLFFRSFLSLVVLLTAPFGEVSDATLVAAAHTAFNALNAAAWAPVVPWLSAVLEGRRPSAVVPIQLTASVRRLLADLPDEAREEVERERDRVLVELKVALDGLLDVLVSGDDPARLLPRHDLKARLAGAQELLAAIAVRGGTWTPGLQRTLRDLHAMEEIIGEAALLVGRMQVETSRYASLRHLRVAPLLPELREASDRLWAVLLGVTTDAEIDAAWFDVYEIRLREAFREDGRITEAEVMALSRDLAHLQRIFSHLVDMARARLVSRIRPSSALRETQ